MQFVTILAKVLNAGSVLLVILLTTMMSASWAPADQSIEQLSERTLELFQCGEDLQAQRKILDNKIQEILERERISAETAKGAAIGNNDEHKETLSPPTFAGKKFELK